MLGPQHLGTVILPSITQFALPRALARKVLQLGEKLLSFDAQKGCFVLNEPAATRIALGLFDNDDRLAQDWLKQLQDEYNEYVLNALKDPDGVAVSFIP